MVTGLVPPCSYQGGKQRLAVQILDVIDTKVQKPYILFDLCCGSGAIGLEAVNRGHSVIMIDRGEYGSFYEAVGAGTLDLSVLRGVLDSLPSVEGIQEHLQSLSERSVDPVLRMYHYLILQAGAFGSKQIWVEGTKWCNNSFRRYWLPTETSNRKSPVNPMMPMPETIYARVESIITGTRGYLTGYQRDIFDALPLIMECKQDAVIYIDPPYMGTETYGYTFDLLRFLNSLPLGLQIFISEGRHLEFCDEAIQLSRGRRKGNISGKVSKELTEEWLNLKISQ